MVGAGGGVIVWIGGGGGARGQYLLDVGQRDSVSFWTVSECARCVIWPFLGFAYRSIFFFGNRRVFDIFLV